MQKANPYHYGVVILLLVILVLPLAATLLYALSTDWSSLLPSGLTLHWFSYLWTNSRFLTALYHSLFVCVGALLLSCLLILPTLFVIAYRFPKLGSVMNVLVLLPFAIPPIISSVGLLQVYSKPPFDMTGTPWILMGCYFTIALPFIHRTLSNGLQSINLHDLMDSAHLLGASTFKAALFVLLPNLRKSIIVALLLSFSFLIGEFVFANILVGTRYETVQVYLNNMSNESGHFTSAIVISYFAVVLIISLITNAFTRHGGTS